MFSTQKHVVAEQGVARPMRCWVPFFLLCCVNYCHSAFALPHLLAPRTRPRALQPLCCSPKAPESPDSDSYTPVTVENEGAKTTGITLSLTAAYILGGVAFYTTYTDWDLLVAFPLRSSTAHVLHTTGLTSHALRNSRLRTRSTSRL